MSSSEPVCDRCHCTEHNPCVDLETGARCAWVIEGLCSACVTEEELALIGQQMDAHHSVRETIDPRSWRKAEPRFRKVYP